jgi:hypothetical protein
MSGQKLQAVFIMPGRVMHVTPWSFVAALLST